MNSNYLKTKYLIIGAGLSGLSAAYNLKDNFIVTEASSLPGGTAGTLYVNGFKLDNSIHVLYFKNQQIKDWIINSLRIKLLEKNRESSVWINNSFVTYPIQYHLSELSLASRIRSFYSIFSTLFQKRKKEFENFEDFSTSTFGSFLTDIFLRPYNEKLFGNPINNINTDWMGDYVQQYSKVKMLLGLTRLVDYNYGRNSIFYYPVRGGISEISKGILAELKNAPMFNSSLVKIFLNDKTAIFSNGLKINFEYLINTTPLNSFLQKVSELTKDISDLTRLMKKNSTTILHILCRGTLEDIKYHWIYVPDPSIPFYRITIPGNINSANCPAGHFSLTLEFGGDVYKNESIYHHSMIILNKMGFLNKNVSVINSFWKLLDCGYVIYDKNRAILLKKIFPFLQSNQIWSIGRYGSWAYSNMEDALLSGKLIAERLLKLE